MGIDSVAEDNSNIFFEDDNLSYYYGFKSSKSEEEISINYDKKDYLEDERDNEESHNNIEKKKLIPVIFEWEQGGNNVYVTGNFCNWKQFFLMVKEKDGKFKLNINLPKGIYQYKFKVDGEWKYNDKYPTYNENGIINNYIDTTNLDKEAKNIEEKTTTGNSSNLTENHELSKYSKKFFVKSKNYSYLKQKVYSNYIPNKDELKDKIPELPIQYKSCININLFSKQNSIGNNKFIKIQEKNILSDNISFKKIENVYHEQINHLNINNKQFQNSNRIYKNIICSISSRYRQKYTTFVYYKPNKNIKNRFNKK